MTSPTHLMAEGLTTVDGQATPLSPSPASGAGPSATVSAAAVRTALALTPHQLGELTAALELEVGDRPNYPRYARTSTHLLTAVSAMREVRMPLDVAVRAAKDYAPQLLAGAGWLLASPADEDWAVTFVSRGPDLIQWLRASGGRAVVVDLDRLSARATTEWHGASNADITD